MTADARLAREDGTIIRDPQPRVSIRTIAATIAMVLLTAVVLLLGWEVRRVLTWIVVAALHSPPAAIVVLVVFVVYQQLENHVLQPVIISRTVELSALTVLVSILIGGRAVRVPGRAARHPGGRGPPCHRPRPLRRLPRPPKARTDHRHRRAPGVAATTTRTRRAATPRRHRHRAPMT
jgi:hypothetical protein